MSNSEEILHSDIDNVAETLAQLKAAVRRTSGKAQVGSQFGATDGAALTELADLAMISAHLPVSWSTPVLGRAIALSKRATRILLRWYINPIVDQQNSFNAALVRVVASLEERIRELESDLAARGRRE